MDVAAPDRNRPARAALFQLAALVGLCLVAYSGEIARIVGGSAGNPEWAHILVTPLLVALLAFRRRRELAESLQHPGSAWGLAVLAAALLLYTVSSFPFNYAYPRWFSLVPALWGAVAAACGVRFAMRCAPMVLIVLLAVPVPVRQFADLIIRPETMTLKAVAFTLDMLPGVLVELKGADLHYVAGRVSGTVALGEPWRGASLLLASASLGAFVVFSRIRPLWQVAVLAAAAPALVLVVNWFRLALWGVLSIAGHADPLSPVPRVLATTGSLVACYGAFCAAAALLGKGNQVPFSPPEGAAAPPEPAPATREPGSLFTPVFIASAALLVAAAAALQPALDALVVKYTKEPIGVRRSLDEFDSSAVQSFRAVTDDPTFTLAIDPAVGTDDALRLVFEPRAGGDRRRDEDTLLFVTYYNDPRDTIPHTPEVCYRQIGSTVHSISTVTIPLRGPDPEPVDVQARLLDLEPPGWHGALVYVFVCNGRVYHDRNSVRLAIGWPGDRRIYFSKVEVVSRCGPRGDCRGALERATALMAEALPVLMRDHFPGRADVER